MYKSRSRRPSWGERSSAFYSGKTPLNIEKKRENKKNASNIPALPLAAAPKSEATARVPIPDYALKSPKAKSLAAKIEKPKSGKILNGKAKRPSLSEQLASIGAQASTLTASIKANAGLEKDQARISADESPLLSTPSKGFKVGTLECKYPSPVLFFKVSAKSSEERS